MQRRQFLTAAASAATAVLSSGCDPAPRTLAGGFAGIDMARGHQLRDLLAQGTLPAPAVVRRAQVVIAGGGVAGLAAGNSRGGQVNGIACPLGAHYLPVPGDDAREVQDLLEELGLRQRVAGRWQYDERHLCHSPQERLFFQGEWQEGLLPVQGVGEATLAQYRRFAERVQALGKAARFTMPMLKSFDAKRPLAPIHQALDAMTFAAGWTKRGWMTRTCAGTWTTAAATTTARARRACRPGPASTTSPAATAFMRRARPPPKTARACSPGPKATAGSPSAWPRRCTTGGQLRTACSVLRITEGRHGVQVDAFNHATDSVERWQAQRCIVALPVFMAARVVQGPPAFLREAAQRLSWAPWLVANIHIDAPLADRPGAAPAWDNVLYYQALGDVPQAREQLATQPWTHWANATLAALSVPHPDLPRRATRVDITRYGHAMSIPVPGTQQFLSQIGLQSLSGKRKQLSNGEQAAWMPTPATARLAFAHSDWSGYSVFEEAFTRGHGAA
jgi:hypothetical protein